MPLPQLKHAVAAATLALMAVAPAAHAQAIVMAGSYQNFDVLNNTGSPVHGFEMEVWGVSSSQLSRIFPGIGWVNVIRYGLGTATDFPGGVYVRWIAPYDPATGQFTTATPVPRSMTTVPGESCWTLGMPTGYLTAGCEHFGISTNYVNPTKILYRWLVADPANPGSVKAAGADISLPAPIWTAVPPANPALPPVVAAEIPAPPPPAPAVFGDAQWVRVFKTENVRKVGLEELVGDNHAVVAQDAAHLESNWTLLQQDPPIGGASRKRGKLANKGNVGNGSHAVVRRYEFYQYAGTYDPITHEALCADGTCTAPSPGELGDAIGAQNAAANLDVNSLTVAVAGSGSVSSSDKTYSCGAKCYGVYPAGASVTLTAKANSGSSFTGWTGACGGNATTCTVLVNAETAATATFTAAAAGGGGGGGAGGGASSYKLSIALVGSGAVGSSPAGISCGKSCSASFAAGTAVTLVASPLAGKTFVGWGGACTGAATACTVTLSADTKVDASFTK